MGDHGFGSSRFQNSRPRRVRYGLHLPVSPVMKYRTQRHSGRNGSRTLFPRACSSTRCSGVKRERQICTRVAFGTGVAPASVSAGRKSAMWKRGETLVAG